MAKSRFRATKRKAKGKKKQGGGSGKKPAARKSSALKKTNRRATRAKMARNREKYSASKSNLKQAKEKHAATMKSEEKRFATESQQIKDRPGISDEKRRRKLTRLQLARRQREKVASEQLNAQEQTHLATRERYRSAQQRQLEKYRRRKRAVDFADRYARTSVTQRTNVAIAPQQQQYGYAQPYGAPMAYGAPAQYGGAYGVPAQYGGAVPSYGGNVPDQPYEGVPPLDGDVPPYEGAEEAPYAGAAPSMPQEREAYSSRRQYEDERVRQVLTGVEEKEEEVEIPDIPALRELDPRALRAFLRARNKFEEATTLEDRVRYSVEFFELAEKLDAMFHLHTDVWHRVMKYRPTGRSVADARAFADGLPAETVVELSKMDNVQLADYLTTAF